MIAFLRALAVQTIYAPAQAAGTIADMNLSREAGWMALGIASVFNAFAYMLNLSLVTLPEDYWLPVISSPLTYAALSFSVSVVLVFGILWAGRAMGGKGGAALLISLVAWLVTLQSAADFVFLALLVFVPMLAGLFSLAAGLYGIWILINFIKVAHGFPSFGPAILTIVLALMGMTMGLSLFLSVVGVAAMGMN